MVSASAALALISGALHGLVFRAVGDIGFISFDYEWVLADNSNPEHASETPANTTEGWPPDCIIEVTFTEKVTPGSGYIRISAPGDEREIRAMDARFIKPGALTNKTLALHPQEPLKHGVEYLVEVSAGFARDLAGNNFQGSHFFFRTSHAPFDFEVFSPYVQSPDSPVVFAFQTQEHGMYGANDAEYRIQLWPSHSLVFYVPEDSDRLGMTARCARVFEVSVNFPSLEECCVSEDGRFELRLRSPVREAVEYAMVVRWPVHEQVVSPSEVNWHLSVLRQYRGVSVEVQSFKPCRHRFGTHLLNNIDAASSAIIDFSMHAQSVDPTTWKGPETVREFRVDLNLSDYGLRPGSVLRIFSFPLLSWQTNPVRPQNITTLQALDWTDPLHLVDQRRRAAPCPNFFPGDLPFTTQCRILELGFGNGGAYGLELRLPSRGRTAATIASELKSFFLTVPGMVRTMGLVSYWELISVQPASESAATEVHGVRLTSTTANTLFTSDGMHFKVKSQSYPYHVPVGTRINRVELEFATGVFALHQTEVLIDLLDPPLARIETCQAIERLPRLSAQRPVVTDNPNARVRWILQPFDAEAGTANFVAHPGINYQVVCLVYNGPEPRPASRWALTLVTTNPRGKTFRFSREFISREYFVAAVFAGAQVTPTMPVLGRWQTIFVKVALPIRDGSALLHWTAPARRLALVAPPGFNVPHGACRGFRPLTNSDLPPRPLSQCWTGAEDSQVLSISISSAVDGFTAGRTYAFRVTVQNPATMKDVQSRMRGTTTIDGGNAWVLQLHQELPSGPVVVLADVPPNFRFQSSSLKPEEVPSGELTSFRIYQRQINVRRVQAKDPYLGKTTQVFIDFVLQTPLRRVDILQVTAPSVFEFARVQNLRHSSGFGNARKFPGAETDVAGSVIRIMVASDVSPSTLYGLVLDVRLPAFWSSLDVDMNFWILETFFSTMGILDKRSRRDAGSIQGFPVRGSLLSCAAEPESTLREASAFVTLTFRLNVAVVEREFGQPPAPSQLRIRLPAGFQFAAKPTNGNCSGVVRADAYPDAPALRRVQFPHAYTSLPPLQNFHCKVDHETLQLARVLTMEIVRDSGAVLLTEFLFAFRVRIINPAFDRIWDTRWTIKTTDATNLVFEQCLLDSRAAAKPLHVYVAPLPKVAKALAGWRSAAVVQIPADSPLLSTKGDISLAIHAPSGFAFLRDCFASIDPPKRPPDTWTLLACSGRGARAELKLKMWSWAEAFQLTVRTRIPGLAGASAADGGLWTVSSSAQGFTYQTAGNTFPSPLSRAIGPVRFQAADAPAFVGTYGTQRAVLSLVPSASVPAGSVIEVSFARLSELTFDVERPCGGLWEDPGSMKPQYTEEAVPDSPGAMHGCAAMVVSSCGISRHGTKLQLTLGRSLSLGTTYCQVVHTRGAGVLRVSAPIGLSVVASKGINGLLFDMAAYVASDYGVGSSVAPVVPSVGHISICYVSRIASALPTEFNIRLMPTSIGLGNAGDKYLRVRVCVIGSLPPREPSACQVYGSEGVSVQSATCTQLAGNPFKKIVCADVGGLVLKPFSSISVALQVRLLPGEITRAYAKLLSPSENMLQSGSAKVLHPVLMELKPLKLVVPKTTTVSIPFRITVIIAWAILGTRFLENLVSMEEEFPVFLDIATPPGVKLSELCGGLSCQSIVPDASIPLPGIRLTLLSKADILNSNYVSPSLGRVAESLPSRIRLTATAAFPLASTASEPGNMWSFVLRAASLRALAGVALPGFAVALSMEFRVSGSSPRAGTTEARFIFDFRLSAALSMGSSIVVHSPLPEFNCDLGSVEPPSLFGRPTNVTGSGQFGPHLPDGSCKVGIKQPMAAGAPYSFSLVSPNPILTPRTNIWFIQIYALDAHRRVDSMNLPVIGNHTALDTDLPTNLSVATAVTLHSIAETKGFEVRGEFEVLRVLPKSACPRVLSPAAIHFKLRTPLPVATVLQTVVGPLRPAPFVKLRIAASGRHATAGTFDARHCILDSSSTSLLLDKSSSSSTMALLPDDCHVSSDGSMQDFLFHSEAIEHQIEYVMWTWLRTPTAAAANDPEWTYRVETIVADSHRVHRGAIRPSPVFGVRAFVLPGSTTDSAMHRVTLVVFGGMAVLGEAGSVEVTLPVGFIPSCDARHFRPRPALPETARCRAIVSANSSSKSYPGRVIVVWRTLLGSSNALKPSFEFSFGLTNPTSTLLDQSPAGAWHIKLFEGDNQEFPVDSTLEDGLRAFDLCQRMNVSLQREDPTIVSLGFASNANISAGFGNRVKVTLMSSARAPALLACPDTSIWKPRPGRGNQDLVPDVVSGLPMYTVCVPEPRAPLEEEYARVARQHTSTVFFLLPYGAWQVAGHWFGMEVRVLRGLDADAAEAAYRLAEIEGAAGPDSDATKEAMANLSSAASFAAFAGGTGASTQLLEKSLPESEAAAESISVLLERADAGKFGLGATVGCGTFPLGKAPDAPLARSKSAEDIAKSLYDESSGKGNANGKPMTVDASNVASEPPGDNGSVGNESLTSAITVDGVGIHVDGTATG